MCICAYAPVGAMYCRRYSVGLAAIIAGIIASTCVQAATVRAGSAVTVVRDVSGSLPGTSWDKKVEGDDVYESEFVRTAAVPPHIWRRSDQGRSR